MYVLAGCAGARAHRQCESIASHEGCHGEGLGGGEQEGRGGATAVEGVEGSSRQACSSVEIGTGEGVAQGDLEDGDVVQLGYKQRRHVHSCFLYWLLVLGMR